jgi:hypothetical protein
MRGVFFLIKFSLKINLFLIPGYYTRIIDEAKTHFDN